MCKIHTFLEEKKDGRWTNTSIEKPLPNGRALVETQLVPAAALHNADNDILFSLLADVNRFSGVNPISKRRGVPTNASQTVRQITFGLDDRYHHFSWLSVAELDAAAKNISAYIRTGGETFVVEPLKRFVNEIKYQLFQQGVLSTEEEFKRKAQDIRLVFYFEN